MLFHLFPRITILGISYPTNVSFKINLEGPFLWNLSWFLFYLPTLYTLQSFILIRIFFFFHCKLVNSWEVKDCMLFKISKAWQLYLTRWGLFLQILIKDDRFFLHTAPCKLFTKYSWFYIMCECDWGWAASKWITWSASFLVWLESKKGTHFSLNIFLKSSFNRAADSPLCSHCLNIYPNHCEYFWKPRNMFPNPDFSSP